MKVFLKIFGNSSALWYINLPISAKHISCSVKYRDPCKNKSEIRKDSLFNMSRAWDKEADILIAVCLIIA